MNEEEMRKKLKLAFSNDKNQRTEFANSVGEICNHFNQEFVAKQLIQFLTNWYNPNNIEEGIALSNSLPEILEKAEKTVFIAPLIKVLLISESDQISQKVLDVLTKYSSPQEIALLIQNFNSIKYDIIQGFSPKIIPLLESLDLQKELITPLFSCTSFFVRFSVLKMIPKFSPELALFVTEALMHDPQGKIRQLIPAAAVSFDFFPGLVVKNLKADYEWAVRAAVATKACCFSRPEYVLNDVIELFNDQTWEVKNASLKSLTSIFAKFPETKFPEHERYVAQMVAYSFPQLIRSLLGNQTLDLMFELVKRNSFGPEAPETNAIISELLNIDTSSVWSYFFKSIFSGDATIYIPFLKNCYKQIIEKVLTSKNWRDRDNTVKIFSKMLQLFNDEETKVFLLDAAKKLCYDEAFLIRENAAKFIVEQCISEGKNEIPEIVTEMKQSTSFRERQVSVIILHELLCLATDDAFKAKLISEIELFKQDEYENVRSLAESFLPH